MPPNAQADQSTADYWVFEDWDQERDPDDDDDAGMEHQQPGPPPPLRVVCLDYFCCLLIAVVACITGVQFVGFVLHDDRYSVVNVPRALLLTRMHVLPMKPSSSSSPAPASCAALVLLLPTCPAPAPALSVPPVCYEWEKPAAAMVLPGRGSAGSKWWNDEQDSDYNKAAKNCFDSLARDATWTCNQQEDDYMAAMKSLDSQSDDLPPT